MRTIFLSGSDTGIGKTHVAGTLAALLARDGGQVQIVKAVETGIAPETSGGDADHAASHAARLFPEAAKRVTGHTLFTFREPLAPATAARLENRPLRIRDIAAALHALPPADTRIIESAGGLAAPLDEEGADWADFAALTKPDVLVLVVENRLGAINQARLLAAYCQMKALPRPHFWLNEIKPCDESVRQSNHDNLAASGLRILAEQGPGKRLPVNIHAILKFTNPPPPSAPC